MASVQLISEDIPIDVEVIHPTLNDTGEQPKLHEEDDIQSVNGAPNMAEKIISRMENMENKLGSMLAAMEAIRSAVTALQHFICSIPTPAVNENNPPVKTSHPDTDAGTMEQRRIDKGKSVANTSNINMKTPAVSRKISLQTDAFNSLLHDTDVMDLSDDDTDTQQCTSLGKKRKSVIDLNKQASPTTYAHGWERLRMSQLNIQTNQCLKGPVMVLENDWRRQRLFGSPLVPDASDYKGKGMGPINHKYSGSKKAMKKKTNKDQAKTNVKASGSVMPKAYGFIFPKDIIMKSKFRPKEYMGLKKELMHASAYIFGTDLDKSELLFKYRGHGMTRGEFQCLCPSNEISERVIELWAMKGTWTEALYGSCMTWCLPPIFSDLAHRTQPSDDIFQAFSEYIVNWMPETRHLAYIYVPFHEESGHWWLMVINIIHMKIYRLDSNPELDRMEERNERIRSVCYMLTRILEGGYYDRDMISNGNKFVTWSIEDVKGIPNCGHSVNSAEWVIDWMSLGQGFQTNLIGVVHEHKVRMMAALDLVITPMNELHRVVEKNIELMWVNAPKVPN